VNYFRQIVWPWRFDSALLIGLKGRQSQAQGEAKPVRGTAQRNPGLCDRVPSFSPDRAMEDSQMAQSLAKIYIHLIFPTKNRERVIQDDVRVDLHQYMGGILRDLNSPSIEINTQPDHAHVLFSLSRTSSVSQVVQELKTGSSSWLKMQSKAYRDFHWQNGYGAFSVSQSNVPEVKAYIVNQREHHRRMTYQEEFLEFLRRYEIEYDERYVWD
jgi:putative transposase